MQLHSLLIIETSYESCKYKSLCFVWCILFHSWWGQLSKKGNLERIELLNGLGPVYTTLRKFENGFNVFTPETHQIFSVHTAPEKSENASTTGDRKAWVHPWGLGLITSLSRWPHFRKRPFSNCFPPTHANVKPRGVFNSLTCEERLPKAPFSVRISVDGRLNRSNKAVFSNLSGLVCTGT